MRTTFNAGDMPLVLESEPDGDGLRVRLPDGTEHKIAARRITENTLEIETGHRIFRVPIARTERGIELFHAGQSYLFTPAVSAKRGNVGRASGSLAAPMVGVVAEVLVSEGETVAAYQPLVVIEAMKVMASLDAPFAGTVTKVGVTKGQRVAHGEIVVEVRGD